ncbi:hypothetical protein KDL44_10900 [bacterium]|nr:hypothetical protein [bacterium]
MGEPSRDASRAFYHFRAISAEPTSSNVYYVWPENQTWGSYSVFRVIEPIVDIDSYDEIVIEGCGPDGDGRFRMRIVTDQEQIESYSWDYFLVSGL